MPFDKEKKMGALALLGATLCYGSVPVFLRYFTDYLDPWTVNGIRYSVAMLVWLPFVLLNGNSAPDSVLERNGSIWTDAIIPSIVNAFFQIGWAVSPYFLPASLIGFTIRLSFLFTIVFGFILVAEERPLAKNPRFILGASACILGTVLMFTARTGKIDQTSVFGMAVLIFTAICRAGYPPCVRRFMRDYPAHLSFGVISLYSGAILLVLMFLYGNTSDLLVLPGQLWFFVIASGLIGITFSHVMFYKGIHSLGPIVADGLLMLTPFITYLCAWIFLGETLSASRFLGGVIVVVGGFFLIAAKARFAGIRVAIRAMRRRGNR